MTQTSDLKEIELDEAERDILHNGLEILSPDTPEDAEILEALTQKVLNATLEPGVVKMTFNANEIEFCISALVTLNPDDFEVVELASQMENRFLLIYEAGDHLSPGM